METYCLIGDAEHVNPFYIAVTKAAESENFVKDHCVLHFGSYSFAIFVAHDKGKAKENMEALGYKNAVYVCITEDIPRLEAIAPVRKMFGDRAMVYPHNGANSFIAYIKSFDTEEEEEEEEEPKKTFTFKQELATILPSVYIEALEHGDLSLSDFANLTNFYEHMHKVSTEPGYIRLQPVKRVRDAFYYSGAVIMLNDDFKYVKASRDHLAAYENLKPYVEFYDTVM